MSGTHVSQRELYFSIVAQHDNLGDLVIRKTAFDLLSPYADIVHVLSATVPSSFIEAFRFDSRVVVHRDGASFQRSLLRSALKGRAWLILSPGPQHVAPGLGGYVALLVGCARTLLLKALGNRTSAIGRSVLGLTARSQILLERAAVSMTDVYVTRDYPSLDRLASPRVLWAPDVAFAKPSVRVEDPDQRGLVAFSFRADYIPEHAALRRAIRSCRDRGLTPVFVSQVARDDVQHAALAKAHGCDAVLWESRSHVDQLRVVERTYRASVATISNRLHVLILGACGGAVPIVLSDSASSKARVTLEGVLDAHSVDSTFAGLDSTLEAAMRPQESQSVLDSVARAQTAVREAAMRVAGSLVKS